MSYSVLCPSCHKRNIGSAFRCVKCGADLIGLSRQQDSIFEPETGSEPKTPALAIEKGGHSIVESIPHAIWRTLRGSVILALLASLVTAIICWFLNVRTLYGFGNALFYTGCAIAGIGYLIFNGNQQLVRVQTNPLNPMNRAMPGTHSERTRQFWRDFIEGTTAVAVIGVSAALCFGFGILIVNLFK